MGLDWCVEDKKVHGAEDKLKWADAQIAKTAEEHQKAWDCYMESHDVPEVNAAVFPNSDWASFLASDEAESIKSRMTKWKDERAKHVISPQTTLGAPRVGYSDEAEGFMVTRYNGHLAKIIGEERASFLGKFPTVESYLADAHGKYLLELVPEENSGGISGITGLFAGGESFRGKALNYVPWIEDYLDELDTYSNKTPDQLVDMGRLLEELYEARVEEGHGGVDEANSLDLVKTASTWCIFWGTRGHGMWAWY